MVVNAPPEFYEVKKKFDSARTDEEKLKYLQELLKVAPKHKGAENLLLWIKKEIKKYREKLEKKRAKKSGGQRGIKKDGDATISILGIENSGKSALLNILTNARVKESEIPFETIKPQVGMLEYKGAKIQIIEIPSTLEREFYYIVRMSDLLIILFRNEKEIDKVIEYLDEGGIVINKEKPPVKVIKKHSGGIEILGKNFIDVPEEQLIKSVKEFGYPNATVVILGKCSYEDFLNGLDESKEYKRAIFVLNVPNLDEVKINGEKITMDIKNGEHIKRLKEIIWNNLKLIRVYTRDPSTKKIADNPLILQEGARVRDAVIKINRRFLETFKYATVIRNDKKIKVGLDYELKDGDIIEIKTS